MAKLPFLLFRSLRLSHNSTCLCIEKCVRQSGSVEYKTSGWKLSEDKKSIHITDKTGIGKLKLVGSYNRQILDKSLIKRVRPLIVISNKCETREK